MKTKTLPAIIMLLAGFIACITGMNAHMEVADFMKMLFVVLIIFYILGCVIKAIIDKNFAEMNEEETTDGEMPEEEDITPLADENETAEAEDEEE